MEVLEKDIVVVKVGTSTLTEKQADGRESLDRSAFRRIGTQLMGLREAGYGTVLVSSAAITAGMAITGQSARPSRATHMHELQRLASIGQRHILNAWAEASPGSTIGELLLTRHELDLASERDELLTVTHTLLTHGDIAIANENDSIAHEEIAFGDNDTLAATFAACIGRSALFGGQVRLVLLTDVDGVYADKDDPSSIIRQIDDIDAYEQLAGGAGSANGTGGMVTKFAAARIAMEHGIPMWIANGKTEDVIQLALRGEAGTGFGVGAADVSVD
ncbi:MAG TPA: hypothetical protein VGS08_00320 [Candidatus Saccharimonadales bacterium]|nr:hypothetical protein [Candidatus Saccharimonadales bacterium]